MAFLWPLGSPTTQFTHSSTPVILPTKSGPQRALSELCKDVIPHCKLNPFLFNGHLQTCWTALKLDGPLIHYKRRVFASDDESLKGHFTVDFVVAPPTSDEDAGLQSDPVGVGHHRLPPRTTYFTNAEFEDLGSDDTKPLLIILHGLSGGSFESYLRHAIEPLVRPTAEGEKAGGISGGEWEALVVNSRGCAGSRLTSSLLYNARATWDVRQTVKWCRKQWPNRPLFAIGFSLGANILTNYVAEEGSSCLINAAIVLSNPWALDVGSVVLQSTWLGREVYSATMGKNLLHLFDRHKEQISQNKKIDVEAMNKLRYLHEFDRAVQCAIWDYPTEGAYYRDASSADSVLAIRIPFLAINAKDDPVASDQAVPYEEVKQNPYVVLCTTSGGGHLGWFELGGGRWHQKPVEGFFNAMAREVDFSRIEPPAKDDGALSGGFPSPFAFDPMRRKAFRSTLEQ